MDFLRTFRQLARRLSRSPSFTLISITTLALGIGATTAMYAVIDGVLLEPLPYPEHERLVGVWHKAPGLGFEELNQSPALHVTYADDGRVFEEVGIWDEGTATITGVGAPTQVEAMYVTDGTLQLLGARPVQGRIFSAADDEPGAPLTVMVSHDYWRDELGGRPVAGTTLTVNGRPREVIGVLPPDFSVLDMPASVYMPLQFDRTQLFVGNFGYQGIARLRPGVTIAQANADMDRLLPVAFERYPGPVSLAMAREAGLSANVRPLSVDVIGDIGSILWVLLGTVAIVLLIACGNVANLFVVRAEGRYREVAVRSALGASRRRIAGEFMIESLALSIVAGVVGIGLAAVALRVLHAFGPDQLPRLDDISLDPSVLGVAVLVTLITGAMLGLVPILRLGGDRVAGVLREGGRGGSAGRERHRVRDILVVGQLALALVLLAGSGLMIRSALAMRNVDPGFDKPEEMLTLRISIPGTVAPDAEQIFAMHERILRGLQALPGVEAAAATSALPMSGWDSNDPIDIEEFAVPSGQIAPIRRYTWISPEYFETMGMPMVAGRGYTWDDIRSAAPYAVISENLAREYWDDPREAIGARVRTLGGRPWREVIGVVGDLHTDGVDQPPVATAYWPMLIYDLWEDGAVAQNSMAYVLRLQTPATPAFMDAVRESVWAVNAGLPVASVRMLDEILDRSMARTSFTLVMLLIAASVALVLGAVGLYGVISYTVAQRTREFGVRMALGAQPSAVGSLVLRHATALIAIGVTIGIAAALAVTRAMQALLFGVTPNDPVTLIVVAGLLAFVGVIATLVPVVRATRVDPLEALRWE